MPEVDARRELEAIRGLMERAREYRHPPAVVGFIAGGLGVAGGIFTHGTKEPMPLALAWGAIFIVSLAAVVFFTARAAKQDGVRFWSPLAVEVVHALWPPLVGAIALTVALARAERLDLVPALWLLAYGTGGIAAGAHAARIVRGLGLAFFAAGLAQVVLGFPPGIVLAATFGGLHVAYAIAAARA